MAIKHDWKCLVIRCHKCKCSWWEIVLSVHPNILSSFTVSGHHPCPSHPHSSHSLHNTSHHMRPGDPAQLLASGKQTTRFTIMFLPRSTSCVLTTGVCIFHCLIYRRRIRAVSEDLTGGSPLPLPLPPALTLSPCYEIKYSLLALHLSPWCLAAHTEDTQISTTHIYTQSQRWYEDIDFP